MEEKEAVRLLYQSLLNLRADYPYIEETATAFNSLHISQLANTGYNLTILKPKDKKEIVVVEWEDKPFKIFNPIIVHLNTNFHTGEIHTTYKHLCEVFGKHDQWHDKYKQDASWHIEFKDGSAVSIGNYKDGHNYLGKKGDNLVDIKRWDVWGTDQSYANLINILGLNKE